LIIKKREGARSGKEGKKERKKEKKRNVGFIPK
jgi:hypothetical protein